MRFRVKFALFCYMLILATMGVKLVLVALKVFPYELVLNVVNLIYNNVHWRWGVGGAGAAILIFNYMLIQTIVNEYTRGKTIAFDNPNGRVFVSLSAMEDLIRRLIAADSEIKDGRASVTARKKKIDVDARIVLNADGNIPDITAKFQELARQRIEDMLPSDHSVVVRVHVVKIITDTKNKNPKEKVAERSESSFPFQGYRP